MRACALRGYPDGIEIQKLSYLVRIGSIRIHQINTARPHWPHSGVPAKVGRCKNFLSLPGKCNPVQRACFGRRTYFYRPRHTWRATCVARRNTTPRKLRLHQRRLVIYVSALARAAEYITRQKHIRVLVRYYLSRVIQCKTKVVLLPRDELNARTIRIRIVARKIHQILQPASK